MLEQVLEHCSNSNTVNEALERRPKASWKPPFSTLLVSVRPKMAEYYFKSALSRSSKHLQSLLAAPTLEFCQKSLRRRPLRETLAELGAAVQGIVRRWPELGTAVSFGFRRRTELGTAVPYSFRH